MRRRPDFSEPAIKRARSVVAALGLENVELVIGDIHDLEAAMLAGPFDPAFTRCFLMHQADPVRTLGQIAGLLRPGGWIVAHEPLRSPPAIASIPGRVPCQNPAQILTCCFTLGSHRRGGSSSQPRHPASWRVTSCM